nr:ATP-binding cassette transporter Abca3-like3 [Brachionus angularis]
MNDPKQIRIQPIDCPEYFNDELKSSFGFIIPLIIEISFMFTLLINIGIIVREKQTKMKEYLKIIGIRSNIYWISSILRSFFIYFILTILITIIGYIKLNPKRSDSRLLSKSLFKNTHFTVIFASLFIYSIQTSIFTLLLSQFFTRPFMAKLLSILIWLLTSINFYNYLMLSGLKYILCFFPNVGLIHIFQIINQYERSNYMKLDFMKIFSNLYDQNDTNIGVILALMIVFSFLYIPMIWYFEKIMPAQFGISLPFYFIFLPSYWKNKFNYKKLNDESNFLKNDFNFDENNKKIYYENDPNYLNQIIKLKNLTKKYRNGFKTKIAVKNLNINLYENQINGFLGHNGAGKTTLLFMLCGIYPPSSGEAIIMDYDLMTNVNKIRSLIGFCPQSPILYDDLTVYEHLYLIASIKGFTSEDVKKEITHISKLVDLNSELNKKSKNLSGGMKKRLNVAMALIGDSKIIIFDEPSSGVDPKNRRQLWNLLQKFKLNKTIILSTHYMEEADSLCDRIAIMNQGELKCCGSPSYLKNVFNTGFKISIKKSQNFNEIIFKNIIELFDENYSIILNNLNELKLIFKNQSTQLLIGFLINIEKNKYLIGIESYSISSIQIEDIFLKFRIFMRRYILATIILFLPVLIQVVLASIIPSQTNLVNKYDSNKLKISGKYKLGIENYGKFRLPYHISGSYSTIPLTSLIKNFYSATNRPDVELYESMNVNINEFMINERRKNINNLITNYFMGISLNITDYNKFYASLYYSTLAFHSSANIVNEVSNLILAFLTNDYTKSITTVNSPLSSNNSLYSGDDFFEYLGCFDILPVSILNMVNSLIITFMISISVIHISRERINGSKSLQLLSGSNLTIYWISNYIFDLIIFLFNFITMIVGLKIVDLIRQDRTIETYPLTTEATIGYVFMLYIVSSFPNLTLSYIWSFLFKSEIISFIVLFILLGIVIFLDMICSFIELFVYLDPFEQNKSLTNFLSFVKFVFLILFPNVTVKRGLYNLKIRQNSYCLKSSNRILKTNYYLYETGLGFNEPGIGLMILIFFLQFIFGNLIIYGLEFRNRITFKLFNKLKIYKKNETFDEYDNIDDFDVKNEYYRIEKLNLEDLKESLIVKNLTKIYKKKIAVNKISFGIDKSECLGILGLNGAGKTTLIKMIIGELKSTNGSILINGFDLNKEFNKARKNVGYCPQFSYLPEFLIVRECLELFCSLKGLNYKYKYYVLDDLLNIFQLSEFKNTLIQNLSEGNKRKLSTALAYLGSPKLVVLDEPTTGMDPASRIYFWNLIKKSQNFGITTILSSHSMEECENLCTKLSIIENGKLKCIGSFKQLREKFGRGLSVIIKCYRENEPSNTVDILEEFILKTIPKSVIRDKVLETLLIEIENTNQKLYEIFDLIIKNSKTYKIETFSISETSLEQIFLSFSKKTIQNDY